MTGTEVITQARLYLADTTDQSITDAAWLGYINEAQKRFASDTHIMQTAVTKTVSTPTLAFSEIITGLTDYLSVLSILKITAAGLNLPKTSLMDSQDNSTSSPERYAVAGNMVHFMTTSSSFSVSMTFYFSYVPANLSATSDTLAIYEQWTPAIVKYVVFLAHLANRDAGLANGAYQEYLEQVKLAQAVTATRMA